MRIENFAEPSHSGVNMTGRVGAMPSIQKSHRFLKPRMIATAVIFAAFMIVFPRQILGQNDKGRIAGTIQDPAGAVVANAKVTLTSLETGVSQGTISTSTGTYIFPNVLVGHYVLKVDVPGFKRYEQTGIEIHAQVAITTDVKLVIGSESATVVVTSTAPLLQTEQANVGQTVGTVAVNDLPLNGRNWVVLAQLAPGSYITGNTPNQINPQLRGGQVTQNGNEAGAVDYRINGTSNNGEVFGGITITPVPDAVQEFKLEAGNPSAEFGHSSGQILNAILKSGTDQFHGSAWEYLRNEFLNANDYFTNLNKRPRAKYRLNQYGGTFGGPAFAWERNKKTFFFFDYQRSSGASPVTWLRTVPTALMHSSNFTNLSDFIPMGAKATQTDLLGRKYKPGTIFDPGTTRAVTAGTFDPTTGLAATGSGFVRDPIYPGGSVAGITDFTTPTNMAQLNQIPAARLDPNMVTILKLFPSANVQSAIAANQNNNYFIADNLTHTVSQYDVRIDHNMARNTIFGSFSRNTDTSGNAQPFPDPLSGNMDIQFPSFNPTFVIAFGFTHIFSPALINEFRFGLNHNFNLRTLQTANQKGIPAKYGIQGIPDTGVIGGLPMLNWNLFANVGSRRYLPTIQTLGSYDFSDNLTRIWRNHEFKLGVQISNTYGNIMAPAFPLGTFTWNGQFSDNPANNQGLNGLSDALLIPTASPYMNNQVFGGLNGYQASNLAQTNYTAYYHAAYVQDNWKVTPRVTINLGMRWDYWSPYSDPSGRDGNFLLDNPAGLNASMVNGTTVPAVPGAVVTPSATYYLGHDGCKTPMSASMLSLFTQYNVTLKCMGGNTVWRNKMLNFGPRVGINYRITNKWVVRAGYGISYGIPVGPEATTGTTYPFSYNIGNPGNNSVTPIVLANGQVATMENTFANIPIMDPTVIPGNNMNFAGHEYNSALPYAESINLTTQFQLTSKDSFQIGYVASLGRHLDEFRQQNSNKILMMRNLPAGVTGNTYTPMPSLAGNMQFLAADGMSNYNSLQASYEHRFKSGLSLMSNYTYGTCMTDSQTGAGLGAGFRGQYLVGMGPHADYTYCNEDARNLFHLAGEYALPIGAGEKFLGSSGRLMDTLVGGWQVNYIYVYQGGQPFSLGCPTSTSTGFPCVANIIPGINPYAGPHNQYQWLNPQAFSQPPQVTVTGQTDYSPLGGAYNQLRAPSYTNLDSSLFKHFKATERINLEFRAEFFNVLNQVDWGGPTNGNWTSGTLGTGNGFSRINSLRGAPRVGQLALKLQF